MSIYRRRPQPSTPRRFTRRDLRHIPIGRFRGCAIVDTPTTALDQLLHDRRLREPWRNAVLLEAGRRRLPLLLMTALERLAS